MPATTGFLLLDDQAVLIELDTRELRITESEEVGRYVQLFERLQTVAATGDVLVELVRDVRRSLDLGT